MHRIARMIGVSLLGLSGCAGAYHAYPDGCVQYGYCPPRPLAYTAYHGCPTPIAARFAAVSRGSPTAPPSEAWGDEFCSTTPPTRPNRD